MDCRRWKRRSYFYGKEFCWRRRDEGLFEECQVRCVRAVGGGPPDGEFRGVGRRWSTSLSSVGSDAATAQAQTTTILVPQNQVVYETVYDVETVQVPVTVNQTQYRTECRTQTVPVTRTVVEQVPVTVNQTQYRTEYKTQTVPVTKTVVEQVPVTVNQTQYRTEYKTQTVPVTKTVVEQVPVTVNQTQYRTEYKTQTVPVTKRGGAGSGHGQPDAVPDRVQDPDRTGDQDHCGGGQRSAHDHRVRSQATNGQPAGHQDGL